MRKEMVDSIGCVSTTVGTIQARIMKLTTVSTLAYIPVVYVDATHNGLPYGLEKWIPELVSCGTTGGLA